MSKAPDPNKAAPTRPAPDDEDKLASGGRPQDEEQSDPTLSPSTATNPSIKNT